MSTTEVIELASNSLPVSEQAGTNLDNAGREDARPPIPRPSNSGPAPDSNRAWIPVLASAWLCFWFTGTIYTWGVIQGALVARGLSSAPTLAWIGSLLAACIALLAILSAKLLRTIGSRATAFCGIVFLAGGQILSGFTVDAVGGLFVTAGLISGIGVSLCFIVSGSVPAQYIGRKRGLANGVVFAGGGVGGAIISFMLDGLLQALDVAWTFRIFGFITLVTGLPAAWLITDRVPPSRSQFVDWQLFKDLRFVVLFLAGAVATFPLLVPPFFLPLYSTSIGLSPSVGAALVAVFNFSSAVGRIGAGLLSDHLGSLNTLTGSLCVNGLSMLALWPVSTSLAPLVVFAIINGMAGGGFFSLMPTVAGQVFGSARVSLVLGMLVTGWSGGYLMGAPIAGYLLAAYGGQSKGFQAYRPAMYYAGSLALGAAGLVLVVRLRMDRKLKSKL